MHQNLIDHRVDPHTSLSGHQRKDHLLSLQQRRLADGFQILPSFVVPSHQCGPERMCGKWQQHIQLWICMHCNIDSGCLHKPCAFCCSRHKTCQRNTNSHSPHSCSDLTKMGSSTVQH